MKLEQIRKDFLDGKIKAYELEGLILKEVFQGNPKRLSNSARIASDLRLEFLEIKHRRSFERIRAAYLPIASEKILGIEQQIGGASLPLGFAGPLKIKGKHARGEFYLPLATNEAALIAGLNRGCKLINESGGIKVMITREGMTKAPVLEAPSIERAYKLAKEIKERGKLYEELKAAAEREARVSKLLEIQPFQLGRKVWLRFVYWTGDSMGMNSATIYTANAIKELRRKKSRD
jgi:hydroxymethylglutaryl-CoA reductase (NADPH)